MFIANNLSVNEKGNLSIGGVDAVELAEEYGTPLYVMDEDLMRDNCRRFKSSIDSHYDGNGLVLHASKSFCCKASFKILEEEGLGADVVSYGEMYTALKAGFPPEKLYFHGNNKSKKEIKKALENKIGRIVADNIEELQNISEIAGELNVVAEILLRIKPGVDAHTHELVRTGQIDSKFGFALETGEALSAVKTAIDTPNLKLVGVHCHIGSQILTTEPFVLAAEKMLLFIAEIKEKLSFEIAELNLGGGFGVRCVEEDKAPDYEKYMEDVSVKAKEICEQKGLSLPFILIEPGRSIVANAGVTLYTVGSVKEIPNIRTYVCVDGGLGDNPRYSLYKAKYDFCVANRAGEAKTQTVSIGGKCCETDLLGEHIMLQPNAKAGDIIAVFATGAYNYSMSSNYNRYPKPPVVMLREGKSRVVVKKETYDDVIRNDV